ncbi:hypothetical protein KDK_56570 [Dictyobacter kobayashii]|uniref:Uncharacterized protein n=1 Tax=Dictyobacter kobayashii TaxID=2014872 RepID=A0A402ARY0_9CHLR|nr:hypothetical protein KDK_56570 [Dictyobacter kobayashii]
MINAKFIGAAICFIFACLLEIFAIIKYFSFPDTRMVQIGLIFAIGGAILFICAIYLYRNRK